MSENKIYSFLGLARKAGKLMGGDALCEDAMKRRKARLIILTKDAGDTTRRRFYEACVNNGIPLIEFGLKEELGRMLGRDAYAVAVVTDENFAKQIRLKISEVEKDEINITHGGGIFE